MALFFLAIALYVPAIGWGLPHATARHRVNTLATDELLPLVPLAEMRSTFVSPSPNRNYGYPWWHYFVLASVQAPYVGFLWMRGELQHPSEQYPFGLKDPVTALRMLTLIGRLVSVLMGAGVVVAAYFFSNTLWGAPAGVAAALLTMFNSFMIYYSRTGNPDVPMLFWASLALVVYARIFVSGFTNGRAILVGLFTGLALATKDQAVLLLLPVGCALALPRFSWSSTTGYRYRPLLLGFAAFLFSYFVATGMFVDPARHLTHVHNLFLKPERLSSMPFYHPPRPRTWEGLQGLSTDSSRGVADLMTLPLMLVAVAGIGLAVRASAWHSVLVLSIPLLFFLLIVPVGHVVVRYFLPCAFVLAAYAAYALVRIEKVGPRLLWMLTLAILCSWQLLIGLDLSYAQFHETREAASQWLIHHASPGDRVEFFGPDQFMPPLPAEIPSRRIAGREAWNRESGHGAYLLKYLVREGPKYVVINPDQTSQPGIEFSGDCPAEVYAALLNGSLGYTLAAHFPPPALFPGPLARPRLDYPSISPPVRIFARQLEVQSNPRSDHRDGDPK